MKNFKNITKIFSAFFAAVLLLAACGGTDGSVKNHLRLATSNKSNSLSNLTTSEAVNFQIIGNFQEGLMTYDDDGHLAGSMAESWTLSDDETVYTFKLRDSKWQDGTPVTAHDFVFAWKQLAITPTAAYKSMLADIKNGADIINPDIAADVNTLGIKAINDKELEVTLAAPRLYFLDLMAFAAFFPINEAFFNSVGADSYGTESHANVLANGPFKVDSWEDSGYTLSKNENYWNAKKVSLQTVEVRVVEDLNTQATLYENGEIDRLALTGDLVDRFKDSSEITSQTEATIFYFYLSGVSGKIDPVLANKNMRAAVAHSIDKTVISDQLLKNGSLPADYLIPADFVEQDGKDFREAANQYNDPMYSPAKAAEFLTAAKAELGTEAPEFTITIAKTATNELVYLNIKSQIEANLPGVIVHLNPIAGSLFYPEIGKFETPSASVGWGADFVDVATFFSIFRSTDSHNYGLWNNPEFDRLYAQAELETNPTTRWEMFAQMEKILIEDYAIVPTFQRGSLALVKPYVKGLHLNSTSPELFFKYVTVS